MICLLIGRPLRFSMLSAVPPRLFIIINVAQSAPLFFFLFFFVNLTNRVGSLPSVAGVVLYYMYIVVELQMNRVLIISWYFSTARHFVCCLFLRFK